MRTLWILCIGVLFAALSTLPARADDIIITELMVNPATVQDSVGEWFEIYNNTASQINMNGWILRDNAGRDTVRGDVLINAGDYFVFCVNGNLSTNGGVPTDYDYIYGTQGLGLAFSNSSNDQLVIYSAVGELQDSVAFNYSTWAGQAGRSFELKSLTYDNNVDTSWCIAQNLWSGSAGDRGTPGAANDCIITPCDTLFLSLTEVQQDDGNGVPIHDGDFVCTRGVANIANYILDTSVTNFFIQDDNAGVNIFGSRFTVNAVLGDCVVVYGWVSNYNGLCEISSSGGGNCIWDLHIVDHVNPPEALTVTCNTVEQLGEDYEGMLVTIPCVTIVGGDAWPAPGVNANILIYDGTDTCTLRIDKDTDIGGNPQPAQPFTATGIVSQFDLSSPYTEWYELVARAYSDFSICNAAEPVREAPASFKLLGCFPNPFNSATRISFTIGRRADVSLAIYDLLGREVTRTTISAPSRGEYSYVWNGTNLSGEPIATGLYFVQLKTGVESVSSKLLFLK
jgi:hypothetical protein